jgi:hypothetical protein
MEEVWKPVVGWEGFYDVSNLGRVKSLDRVVVWGNGLRSIAGRIMSTPLSSGYPVVVLKRKGVKYHTAVHSLVLKAFVGNRPSRCQACHFDGDRANAKLSNLRWATQSENEADKKRHGTYQYGERNPNAKLTDGQATEIRLSTESATLVAKKYGIHRVAVHDIRNGRRRSVIVEKSTLNTPANASKKETHTT